MAKKWQELAKSAKVLKAGMNLWPVYRFAGVRVQEFSADYRYAKVRLGFARITRNYVGTQFGGTLFSMTDAFWMIMVLENLGPEYVVWDKRGEIEFLKPGTSAVTAEFRVTDELLDHLRSEAADGSRVLHWVETDIVDRDGDVVARVRKQLYVRLKSAARTHN